MVIAFQRCIPVRRHALIPKNWREVGSQVMMHVQRHGGADGGKADDTGAIPLRSTSRSEAFQPVDRIAAGLSAEVNR